MTKRINKVILPVAGLGTRNLPATKAIPKEMLPIVDKPIIQYGVEEAINAGIREIIFIVSPTKTSIKEHFSRSNELEKILEDKNKIKELLAIKLVLPENITCSYVVQNQALGLGHAIFCAKEAIGDEPFAVILPDDLIKNTDNGCLKQMVEIYNKVQASIIAVENVQRENTGRYGIVSIKQESENPYKIVDIVEKPKPEDAPTTLGVVGRYILEPEIFEMLEKTEKGYGGEIQLTDAIKMLLEIEDVYAYEFEGERFDCGSKFGFLEANIQYAMDHDELSEQFSAYLNSLVSNRNTSD